MATSKEVPTQNEDFFTIVGNVFKLYEASWNALKLNLATFIVLALIPIILLVVAIPFIMLPFVTDGGTISVLTTSLVVVALFIIGCIFLPALTIAQLESAKGNKLDVNQAFERSKSIFLPFLGLVILSAIVIVIGFLFFAIPGLAALFFLSLATYVLVDKKVGVIESMKASFEITKANWRWVAALFIVQIVLGILGYIPYLGTIASIGLGIIYYCLPAIVYLKITKK